MKLSLTATIAVEESMIGEFDARLNAMFAEHHRHESQDGAPASAATQPSSGRHEVQRKWRRLESMAEKRRHKPSPEMIERIAKRIMREMGLDPEDISVSILPNVRHPKRS